MLWKYNVKREFTDFDSMFSPNLTHWKFDSLLYFLTTLNRLYSQRRVCKLTIRKMKYSHTPRPEYTTDNDKLPLNLNTTEMNHSHKLRIVSHFYKKKET